MPDEVTKAIASDLGIENLSPEEQKQVIQQFGQVALKAASLAVINKLSDEKKAEFAKLVEAEDVAGVQSLLNIEVPDHEAVARAAVEQEVRDFKAAQAA